MTALRWLNGVLLVFGASMAVTLGVVCLIYAVYLDSAPRLREEWPLLLQSTALFAGLAAVAGTAFFGLLRKKPWRWYGQGALAAGTAVIGLMFWRLLAA